MSATLTLSKEDGLAQGLDKKGWLWYPHRFNDDGSRGCWIRGEQVGVSYFQPIIHDISASHRRTESSPHRDGGWPVAKVLLSLMAVEIVAMACAVVAHMLGVYSIPAIVFYVAAPLNVVVLAAGMLTVVHQSVKAGRPLPAPASQDVFDRVMNADDAGNPDMALAS